MRPQAPPLKTQGIKTKLTPFIARHIDWDWRGRWVEPFLGSGAALDKHSRVFDEDFLRMLLQDTGEGPRRRKRQVER